MAPTGGDRSFVVLSVRNVPLPAREMMALERMGSSILVAVTPGVVLSVSSSASNLATKRGGVEQRCLLHRQVRPKTMDRYRFYASRFNS